MSSDYLSKYVKQLNKNEKTLNRIQDNSSLVNQLLILEVLNEITSQIYLAITSEKRGFYIHRY